MICCSQAVAGPLAGAEHGDHWARLATACVATAADAAARCSRETSSNPCPTPFSGLPETCSRSSTELLNWLSVSALSRIAAAWGLLQSLTGASPPPAVVGPDPPA